MFENLPLHPAIVHLPIGLMMILPLVTLLLAGLYLRKSINKNSLLVVVFLHALLLGTSYLALETGEDEEHQVEKVLNESLIESHEERAEIFMIGTAVVFFISLGLVLPLSSLPLMPLLGSVLVGQFVLVFLGYRVGHSGGELVYVHGAAQAYVKDKNSSNNIQLNDGYHLESDDDEDDD